MEKPKEIQRAIEFNSYPDDYLEEPEVDVDECAFCGFPCTGTYCSKECRKAYEAEN